LIFLPYIIYLTLVGVIEFIRDWSGDGDFNGVWYLDDGIDKDV
jgi:hypothetical protein